MIDYAVAVTLKHGQILHHVTKTNRDNTPLRVRVTGKVQTWKTRPGAFKIPVKHGLYESGYITQDNAAFWVIA